MENDSNDKELIEDLFMSSDFKKLDAILAKKGPNIFRILGWGSDEVRFSKFLAWLMNPNGSHRLDDKFLKAFLEQALKDISDEKKEGVPAAIDIHTMRLDDAEIRTEEQMEGDKRADITIRDYTDGFFCLIENKVWSGEQIYADDSGKTIYQTQDYAKKAKELAGKIRENSNPLLIFLTPYGYSAESEKFIPVSFHTLIETLDQLLEAEAINDVTTTLIKQFRDNLKEVIGMADGTRNLCFKLWAEHKDAIEKLQKNVPNPALLFAEALGKTVKKLDNWEESEAKEPEFHDSNRWAVITPRKWDAEDRKKWGNAYYEITWLNNNDVWICIACRPDFKDKVAEINTALMNNSKLDIPKETQTYETWVAAEKLGSLTDFYKEDETPRNWEEAVEKAAEKIMHFLRQNPPSDWEDKLSFASSKNS